MTVATSSLTSELAASGRAEARGGNMNDEQQDDIPQHSGTENTATSARREAEIQSWIDNVIVPILVQEILKTRAKVGGDPGPPGSRSSPRHCVTTHESTSLE